MNITNIEDLNLELNFHKETAEQYLLNINELEDENKQLKALLKDMGYTNPEELSNV